MDVDYQGFAAQMGNNNRQAIASLMQLIQSNKESKRLEQKDAQARQLQDLQLAKLKEEQAYQEGLKKAMAAPQSTTELTQAPVQPLPSLATLGLNRPDYVPPPSAAPRTPQEQSDIEGLQANVTKYPGLAKLAGADARLEQMKAAAPTAQPQPSLASLGGLPEFAPQPPNVQTPMLPGVAQTTKAESPLQAGQRFAASQGRLEDAAKMVSLDDTVAQMGAKLKASGGDLAQYYEAKQSLDQGKEFMEAIKPYAKNPNMLKAMWPQIQQTFPKYASLVSPDQVKSEADGVIVPLKTADGTPVPGKAVYQDAEGKTHIIDTVDKEALADKRQAAQDAALDKRLAASDRRTAQQIAAVDRRAAAKGGGHGGMDIKMNGLNPAQTDALTTAIGEGRLDPYKINSKNQQILADAALKNPGIDLNDMAANLGLARNKDVQMKGAIAETVPPLLKSIVENGKKLNYSDNKFLGMAQQWIDKTTNNPQLVKYMTLRNDQLLTLGGIMRSGGMTDMAQKLEEEAAHPTMSPKALEAWLEGQMESVAPRLNMYRSIRGGKGAPRPAASPAAAAPPPPKTFDALPSPAGLTGRTITDSHTGKRYRSDGKSWRPM